MDLATEDDGFGADRIRAGPGWVCVSPLTSVLMNPLTNAFRFIGYGTTTQIMMTRMVIGGTARISLGSPNAAAFPPLS